MSDEKCLTIWKQSNPKTNPFSCIKSSFTLMKHLNAIKDDDAMWMWQLWQRCVGMYSTDDNATGILQEYWRRHSSVSAAGWSLYFCYFIFFHFFLFLVSCCPELNYCHWEHPAHKLESYQKPVIGKNACICGDSKGNYRFTFLLCAFVRLCTAWLNEKRSKTDITRAMQDGEWKKKLYWEHSDTHTHMKLYIPGFCSREKKCLN